MAVKNPQLEINVRKNTNSNNPGYGKYYPKAKEKHLDEKGQAADTRTPAQRTALIALIRSLKNDYPDHGPLRTRRE